MQLLDLPLVIVQDIIEILVLRPSYGSSTESSTLELRLVNSLFESEITKYWGRHQLCDSLLLEGKRFSPPCDFINRLLREHIGLSDRNECKLASKVHVAVDMLAEQFIHCTREQKQREELLHDACETMVQSSAYRRFFTLGPCERPPGKRFDFRKCDIIETAIQIATIKQYRSVFVGLCALAKETKEACPHDHLRHKIWPAHHAIRFGHADILQTCFSADVSLGNVPNLRRALLEAAKAGYDDVLELATSRATMGNAEILIDVAAEYQRWDLVRVLLDRFGDSINITQRKSILCWASRHGNNDMVLRVMEYNVRPRTDTRPECNRWPIREAVRGGHISTVQLLLDNGAMGDNIESHVDVLARYVAISGNFALFELLKQYYFWKPSCEYNFLPLAAEHGHMDFAKYAIASKPKQRKTEKSSAIEHLSSIEQLQYFSLFRAVVNGRCDIVRLLVQEVGLNLSEQLCWSNDYDEDIYGDPELLFKQVPCLTAIVLAVDAGNVNMARLLVHELGAGPLSEDEWTAFGYPSEGYWKKNLFHVREMRKECLRKLGSMLRLGDDYSTRYTEAPWSAVSTAYLVARGAAS